MLRRKFVGVLVGAVALTVPTAFAVPGSAATNSTAPDSARTVQQTTLYYDASQAPEYADAIKAGAESWNNSVENVQLLPADGGAAEITIIADPGWPRAELGPVQPGGNVTIWFGQQAVDEGYDPVRIAAHEMGHSLGLPDLKPGPCSSLMSGSTGGVDCTNATPNAEEIAMAEQNYGTGKAEAKQPDGRIIVDRP